VVRGLWARWRAYHFDDGAGLPAAEPGHERLGRVLAIVAGVWFAAAACWEIAAPFGAGHYAAATAVFTGGENMWRFGTLGPITHIPLGDPSPSDYYCHHPFGIFWTAAFFSLLGHHDWVCRLPAVLLSACMPVLLYKAGRALWSPFAGGITALAFSVLPITLAYANFFALEVPAMFGMALAIWAYARFVQAGRRRFATLFVIGLTYAAAADWPGFVFAGFVLAALLLRGFLFARFFPPLRFARFAATWAVAATSLVLLAAFHLAYFSHLDQLTELLRQGEFRSQGAELPLSQTLLRRRYWILLAFTPLAILIGKLAAPVFLVRVFVFRRELEFLPLALLATATLQYVVFKQGADIHFFWPHYFALYFAYACGALVFLLGVALTRAAHHLQRPALAPAAPLFALSLGVFLLGLIIPDGLRALRYARKSGGRFNEKGYIIHSDFDKEAALRALAARMPPEATLGLHGSMKQSYWMDWVLERPLSPMHLPRLAAPLRNDFYALDMRFTPGSQLRTFARDFAVHAYGPFLTSDLHRAQTPLTAEAVHAREPNWLTWLFVTANHAEYVTEPDAWLTWELRVHLQNSENPLPNVAAATTAEGLRIAHNAAVATGDGAAAAALRTRLVALLDRAPARAFSDGVELLGVRFEPGASDLLSVYFVAAGALERDVQFGISSHVLSAPFFSLTPKDVLPWDVGMPFALPTSLWRPGFIYRSESELVRRPGRERYVGAFRGAGAPEPLSGAAETPLLTLPR
jgi:hypothetical protein